MDIIEALKQERSALVDKLVTAMREASIGDLESIFHVFEIVNLIEAINKTLAYFLDHKPESQS